MEYERKGVTIIWEIENIKFIRRQHSPTLSIDELDGTKWKLELDGVFGIKISLNIKREENDDGPNVIGLHYTLSEIKVFETPSINVFHTTPSNHTIKTCSFRNGRSSKIEILDQYYKYSNLDKCAIRCKIWKQQGSIATSSHYLLQTRMKTECSAFVGEIGNFSSFSQGYKEPLKIVSSTTCETPVTVNMFLRHRSFFSSETSYIELNIEFNQTESKNKQWFYFKLFILDSSGSKTDIGKLESGFRSFGCFQLTDVSKEYLMKNEALYLPNDTLSLHFEITYCTGIEYEKVKRIENETGSFALSKQANLSSTIELLTSKEGIPYDMKLQTLTETFPAHTAILSAQSPVFEAMFNTNMTETIQKCVHIKDVDAEIMKRLLVFLYAGALEELEWKDAVELYVAANKYQILSLKQKCSVLLEQSVDLSNCCVLLILADMHQDEDLNADVKTYILQYATEILNCHEWRNLEKNLPQLAIDTLRDLLMDIRIKQKRM